jgi:hypothetical protein
MRRLSRATIGLGLWMVVAGTPLVLFAQAPSESELAAKLDQRIEDV